MDILAAFALVAITTTSAVWLTAHHARLERHHRGQSSPEFYFVNLSIKSFLI